MANSGKDSPLVHRSASFAWYLLPIFLTILGGIIAYILLRKRDPRLARNALLLGIVLFILFIAFIMTTNSLRNNISMESEDESRITVSDASANLTDSVVPHEAISNTDTHAEMSVEEIKSAALNVPYELLVDHNDVYVGDIIHYTGHVTGVLNNDDGSYTFKVEVYDTDDRFLAQDRLIWSNYTPKTDEERSRISNISSNSGLFTFANSENAVNVWATLNGLRDFSIMFDTQQIPESDILILEMLTGGSVTASADESPTLTTHTISYAAIPNYVDSDTVISALNDAIYAWEADNPSIDFVIVQDNAGLDIDWLHFAMGYAGKYSSYNVTDGDKITIKHRIEIVLGQDDCNSEYRQFSHNALKHTIAHELGHYLGLRHIDEPNNLMHSDGFPNDTDSLFSYNTQGYNIPVIAKAEYRFMVTEEILDQVDQTNGELSEVVEEYRNLKNNDETDISILDDKKEMINALTQKLTSLEKQLDCTGEPKDLFDILSIGS